MSKNFGIKPVLEGMDVGQSITYPIVRLLSVKATASNVGLVMNRKYSTKVLRQERKVEVTRVS